MDRSVRVTGALKIYRDRNLLSPMLAEVELGIELHLGATTLFEDHEWIEAQLPNGTSGYVLGTDARADTTLGNSEKVSSQSSSSTGDSATSTNTGSGLTWFDRASLKVMNIIALAVLFYIMRACQEHH